FLRTFPIITWLPKYNPRNIIYDLIAGISVGMMVIPQGLADAKIATLPLEYGLYTSYMCTFIYLLLGTARTVTVGPTAVLSLFTAQAIQQAVASNKSLNPVDIGLSLAFISGLILLGLGVFRLGIVFELIPAPVIVGFVSAAATSIIVSQVPNLLGLRAVNNKDDSYMVIYNIFKQLKNAYWRDIAFGLSSLAFMILLRIFVFYLVKWAQNPPKTAESSTGAQLVAGSEEAANANANADGKTLPLSIIRDVPTGFYSPRIPHLSSEVVAGLGASRLISTAIVTMIEHISIIRAHARQDGYVIDNTQELVALGLMNFISSTFGAFPATGSFSRSVVNRASGAVSTFATAITGIIVIFALNFLPPAFYFIPNPTLAAIIIINIRTIIASPKYLVRVARVSKVDAFAGTLTFVVSFLLGLELGLAVGAGFSLVVLLLRIARPKWTVNPLGAVGNGSKHLGGGNGDIQQSASDAATHPHSVLVFKVEESLTFPNADYIRKKLIATVGRHLEESSNITSEDDAIRPSQPTDGQIRRRRSPVPLGAVVFDFSAVNFVDASGIQSLLDIRSDLERLSKEYRQKHPADI
ncbi:hypothetical protein GQ42DRAFT_102545, partial [Ramicandelaber brevisporus]